MRAPFKRAGFGLLPHGKMLATHSSVSTYSLLLINIPDGCYRFVCYLEQTSLIPPVAPALTLYLSISCSLFLFSFQRRSFVFNSLQPLFPKHTGWVYPLVTAVAPVR